MSRYYVEVTVGEGLVAAKTVEADLAEVEFGVLKFYKRGTSSNNLVSAFMQWNNFKPEEG